jgi:hypothetical protein
MAMKRINFSPNTEHNILNYIARMSRLMVMDPRIPFSPYKVHRSSKHHFENKTPKGLTLKTLTHPINILLPGPWVPRKIALVA